MLADRPLRAQVDEDEVGRAAHGDPRHRQVEAGGARGQALDEQAQPEDARLDGHGRPLEVGEPANLCLVDPAAQWTVDARSMATRSRNTPYEGDTLPARVVATFLRGRPTVLDGKPA